MKLRLHKRPHTSWFFHDNGYMRAWLVIVLWLILLGAVAYGCYWLVSWLVSWLDSRDLCEYPNHLVYTGQRLQPVGKVLMWVDQYSCVGN